MDLPMANALIAASLEHVGADTLYTSDSGFAAYEGPMEVVFL
jgi:predicted nucleic acid-binding protein